MPVAYVWTLPARSCYPPSMLDLAKVNDIVKKAASATLKGSAGVQRVDSEPTSDSEGQEALHITIVLKRGSGDRISGDTALDTLVRIHRALSDANEERFPIISYVTEEELESSDDPES
jgi:hypothetical protein